MTIRIMPPGDGVRPTITVNGRTYTCALGSFLDVPDDDATMMSANRWIMASSGGAGASTARPAAPLRNSTFHDTTLGFNIVFDGRVWRNPTSGAAV